MAGFKRMLLVLLALMALSLPAMAMSVTFINPGKSGEAYWVTVSQSMAAAARSLGIRLEIIYLERQHPKAIEFAHQIASRPADQRPDYVMLGNEGGVGPESLRILDAAGIKVFLVYSGIAQAAERLQTGSPREKYPHWLGSLEPLAEEAGYLTAKALIAKGRETGARGGDGKLHLLAISGDRATPSSIKRSDGMRRAVAEAGNAVVDQEIFSGFNREKAAEQSEWLFKRFPATRLVWAANDLMAFGAMQTWEAMGGQPGKDAWFSGINTSVEAMEAIRSGRLATLSGGHFILGAWALVMLHDHHKGKDFAQTEGLELSQSMFTLFTPREAALFTVRFGQGNFDSVNFRKYSKVLNPKIQRYNFNFRQVLGE
jgi:ABC-type sugar transport system substrate-binding protein